MKSPCTWFGDWSWTNYPNFRLLNAPERSHFWRCSRPGSTFASTQNYNVLLNNRSVAALCLWHAVKSQHQIKKGGEKKKVLRLVLRRDGSYSPSHKSLIVDVWKTCRPPSHTGGRGAVTVSMRGMRHLSQQKPNLAISAQLQILVVWGNRLINMGRILDGW